MQKIEGRCVCVLQIIHFKQLRKFNQSISTVVNKQIALNMNELPKHFQDIEIINSINRQIEQNYLA